MEYLLSHKLATFSFLYKMWWGNDLVLLYLANSTWPVNPPNISSIADFRKAGKHIWSRSIPFPTLGNTSWESRKIKWPNWDLKDLFSKWHLYRSYYDLGMMFHFKFICQCVETFSIGTVKALVCTQGTWKPKALRQVSHHRWLQAQDINSAEVVRTCSKHSILLQVLLSDPTWSNHHSRHCRTSSFLTAPFPSNKKTDRDNVIDNCIPFIEFHVLLTLTNNSGIIS